MTFTRDWSHTRTHWPDLFVPYVARPGLRFLEIGCFEGQATCWLLEHVLVGEGSTITVIDPFTFDGQIERFRENIDPYPYRVEAIHATSGTGLLWLHHYRPDDRYELIYVDGSHHPADVLSDAVLAWPLLAPGGLMLFDDYDWPDHPTGQDVRKAVDAFTDCYELEGELVGADQYLVRKDPA